MTENFIERPYKNEKDNAIRYVKNLLMQAHEDNRNEDIEKLEELIRLLHTKKYGLVWEEHAEIVEEEMKTKIPVFVEYGDRKIIGSPDSDDYNFLLEGDNLHSLNLLEKTHAGRIDVIYIDPPYNTGNKDFVYNDKIVDKTDGYSHSKWLSFMSKRLEIARKLLSDKGVIFISIDDNEQAQLKLLCDEIFGEGNISATFCVIRAEGGGMAKQVIKGHEYCFVYAKNISQFSPLARAKDVRGKIVNKEGIDYWIQEDWLRKEFGKYGNCHYEEILEFKGQEFKNEVDDKISRGEYILIPKKNGLNIVGKLRRLDEDSSKFYSVIKHLNKEGIKETREVGIDFSYPKPISLIKDLVKGATFFDKSGVVLDFFAGSGTTGHAVTQLNKEDGGNRKYILCTNNENKIAEEVTYRRLNNIQSELPHNLKYFKTEFVDKIEFPDVTLESELLKYVTPLVELEFGIDISNPSVQIILTEEHLEALLQNQEIKEGASIFIHPDVFLDTKEQEQLSELKITLQEIPDYFFGKELWS